jgi:lambda repressor-like predicted transcriptional regulator
MWFEPDPAAGASGRFACFAQHYSLYCNMVLLFALFQVLCRFNILSTFVDRKCGRSASRVSIMSALQIRVSLREKGYYLADIAKALGVSRSLISKVVDGSTKSRVVANSIAALLDKTPEELWPGLYPDNYVTARKKASDKRVNNVRSALAGQQARTKDNS